MKVWNMAENFSVEWKIFSMEWNEKKLPAWNMEKSSSISYLPRRQHKSNKIAYKVNLPAFLR